MDDLLNQESFGQISLDPAGRYAAVERRGPYAAGARFDLGHQAPQAGTRLFLISLDAPTEARELMAQPSGYGYLLGPWSPDGRQLAVYRLGAEQWELGVLDLASGRVRWLGLIPASLPGRNVEWRSPSELIVLASAKPPAELRRISEAAHQMPPRWSASAGGRGAHTAIGSGVWRNLSPGPEPTQVVDVDVSTGRARVVRVGAFVDLKLSPSGAQIALLERGEPLQPANGRSPQGDWGVAAQARRLGLLDLHSGVLAYPCSGRDVLETLLSWSPTSDRLLIFARPDQAPWSKGEFYSVEGGSNRCQRLAGRGFSPALRRRPEAIETAWLGDWPIVRGQSLARREGRLDWWRLSSDLPVNLTAQMPEAPRLLGSQDGDLVLLAASRLWRMDAKGGLEPQPGQALGAVAWRPPERPDGGRELGRALLLTEAGRPSLRTLKGPIGLDLETGETVVGFSAAKRVLLVTSSTPSGVSLLKARRAGKAPAVAMRLNRRLADTDPMRVLPIAHSGPDGKALLSWLYLPAPGACRPALVVRPYLGDNYRSPPSSRPPVLGLVADTRVLVGRGYGVLLPSLPLAMSQRDPLEGLAKRILDVVDAAARQAPGQFDPERLAIWGHSYGGYAALGTIGQTDRFKAAISMNAPTDLISIYGSFQPSWRSSPEDGVWPSWPAGWAEDSQGRMGAPPWQVPDRYIANSPLFWAMNIHTPVMLVHADQDPVPLNQAEEMFSALYRQNKDAVLVTYWGEGHIVASPGNVRDLYRRASDWLDYYLRPPAQNWRRPACPESGT
ncbi:S9 family peptidase [Phenylobacterium koreense]|uniref:Dipeptidyl aminopeptidase/acylaminoacyl peptidase n=1 Tax=Phenylobacterium koreense TaxID=266125 RepID=A0ABV2EM91_9CAUL